MVLKKSINLFVINLIRLILFLFITSAVQAGNISQTERNALMAIYNSTDGINWLSNSGGWMGVGTVDGTECNWFGVLCVDVSGITHVKSLILSENNLIGTIPPEIGNLSSMTNLSLSYNQLSGTIPPEIGNLTALTFLFLRNNQLNGSIPSEIGSLSTLEILNLNTNQLSGYIPPSLQNLMNLSFLRIHTNGCLKTLDLSFSNFLSNFDPFWVNCNSPDTFVFTEQTEVNLETTISSNIITINGLIDPISISVSNGQIAINGIAINPTASATASNGDEVQVVHESASNYNKTVTTTVAIGELSVTFSSTTSTNPAINGIIQFLLSDE